MEVQQIGNAKVVKIVERVDSISCEEVNATLQATIATGPRQLICDFTATKYISSAGLRVFLLAAKNLKKAGGQLVIVCAKSNYVYEVLELTGITHIVSVVGSMDEAMAQPC